MNRPEALLTSQAIDLQNGDRIRVTIWHQLALPPALFLRYVILPPTGDASNSVETIVVPAASSPATLTYVLSKGLLISAVLFTTDSSIVPGQIQASIAVQRSNIATGQTLLPLISGPISTGYALNFPFSPSQDAAAVVPGVQRIQPTPPAVGAPFTVTLPDQVLSQILFASWEMDTDATVASRQAYIAIIDGSGVEQRSYSAQTQAASLSYSYATTSNVVPTANPAASTKFNIPFPAFNYGISGTITISAANLQAGDAIGNLVFYMKQNQVT
jgi:hypothetical protein